eukprot:581869-Rhodomonas_salina.2
MVLYLPYVCCTVLWCCTVVSSITCGVVPDGADLLCCYGTTFQLWYHLSAIGSAYPLQYCLQQCPYAFAPYDPTPSASLSPVLTSGMLLPDCAEAHPI